MTESTRSWVGKYESECPECGNVDKLTERELAQVHCQRCYHHYAYSQTVIMTESQRNTLHDIRNKLDTVYEILAEYERTGNTQISTDLVQALLAPTKTTIGEALDND